MKMKENISIQTMDKGLVVRSDYLDVDKYCKDMTAVMSVVANILSDFQKDVES